MSGKVLVLGGDTRAFLAVVRSLGRRGVEVHAGWCDPDSPARRSRYLRAVHDLPPFSPDDLGWKEALRNLLGRERFDLLIPCEDPTLLPIRAFRSEFESLARLALPEEEACAVAFDKIRSHELARTLSIPVPRSRVVEHPEDLAGLDLRPPLVLKPPTTFAYPDLTNRRGVRVFPDPPALREFLHRTGYADPVLVQEFFSGIGVGVEVLADRGEVLVAFQHERVHEPLRGGGSSYRRSVRLDPDLLDAARRLVGALRYTGVAMVEFRRNPRTGAWVFLEINGRFWGSLPLAVACGADFPYYLYRLLVHGERGFPQTYRVGVYGRNLTLDLVWLREYVRSLHSLPPFAPAPRQVAGEVRNLLLLREHNDTLTRDDPAPGLAEVGKILRSAVARVSWRVRRLALRVGLVRGMERARLRRRLATSHNVLFVCRGNICRSPFAQAYAARIFPRSVRVQAAGTRARPGATSPPEALKAASAFGVDLRFHRAVRLEPALLEQAQVVLTFDASDLERVRREHPEHREKVFLLGLLLEGDPEIRDPYGADGAGYRAVYGRIARAVEQAGRWVARPEGVR
ncbi:MAG: ATP-grasp domain-containing protein [Armatimonadota bacterium]|nr:ATP-grasp domain-containing protein [Armatimonadota bacterium]MDR7443528.1 ATP-grasp domain-containing protein [Armatimonadota bacterium]MDR7570361.1 ATP-grasp domain-containing protein [Armatimonadota bacterium]MDR7615027.1 ATP-grasp domain-containing protein [Armatimonadota bacterium]